MTRPTRRPPFETTGSGRKRGFPSVAERRVDAVRPARPNPLSPVGLFHADLVYRGALRRLGEFREIAFEVFPRLVPHACMCTMRSACFCPTIGLATVPP